MDGRGTEEARGVCPGGRGVLRAGSVQGPPPFSLTYIVQSVPGNPDFSLSDSVCRKLGGNFVREGILAFVVTHRRYFIPSSVSYDWMVNDHWSYEDGHSLAPPFVLDLTDLASRRDRTWTDGARWMPRSGLLRGQGRPPCRQRLRRSLAGV